MLKRIASAVIVFAAVFLFRMPVGAHPHAWIDLETTAVFDEQGRFAGLDQIWLFGDFYSGYVLADIGSDDRDVIIDGLREVASRNLANLQEFDYFTVVEADGQAQSIAPVETFETGVIQGRIYLKFTTRLEAPVDAASSLVRHAVYDPSYYIEVLYVEGSAPRLPSQGAPICSVSVEKPNPTFDDLAYASSLDRTETSSDGLGKVFAEWTTLTCE